MSATELHPYVFLTVLFVMAVMFPLVPLALARAWAWRFAPARPGPQKNATYECGIETRGIRSPSSVRATTSTASCS